MFKKLFCLVFGHKPEFEHRKDMFGKEYRYQRCFCKKCGKQITVDYGYNYSHHYE